MNNVRPRIKCYHCGQTLFFGIKPDRAFQMRCPSCKGINYFNCDEKDEKGLPLKCSFQNCRRTLAFGEHPKEAIEIQCQSCKGKTKFQRL